MSETICVETLSQDDPRVAEIEYEVYVDAGYIAPNPMRRVPQNDHYPDHEIIAAFVNDVIVGSVRLVIDAMPRSGVFSLPCFDSFDIWPWAEDLLRGVPADRLLQGGTMVIRESYRGGAAFQTMFQKMLERSLQKRIQFAVAVIDENFFNRLNRRGVPLLPMGETRHYMGSRTVPALIARDWVIRGAVLSDILALSQQYDGECPGVDQTARSA